MKAALLALVLTSPTLFLAYQVSPAEMQQVLAQLLRYLENLPYLIVGLR